jgi:hypothetical protein
MLLEGLSWEKPEVTLSQVQVPSSSQLFPSRVAVSPPCPASLHPAKLRAFSPQPRPSQNAVTWLALCQELPNSLGHPQPISHLLGKTDALTGLCKVVLTRLDPAGVRRIEFFRTQLSLFPEPGLDQRPGSLENPSTRAAYLAPVHSTGIFWVSTTHSHGWRGR